MLNYTSSNHVVIEVQRTLPVVFPWLIYQGIFRTSTTRLTKVLSDAKLYCRYLRVRLALHSPSFCSFENALFFTFGIRLLFIAGWYPHKNRLCKLVADTRFITLLSVFGGTRSSSSSGNPFSAPGFIAVNIFSVLTLSAPNLLSSTKLSIVSL